MGRSADLPRSAGEHDGDDAGCTILHVDMDAFFASVEIRRNRDLAAQPVIVGGAQRGVVAAASYRARAYGVRSAMPMTRALTLCPHAVVLPPDLPAYRAASAEVFDIFRDVTDLVEGLSLDEAFLDVSGAVRAAGRPVAIARSIRERMRSELRLTCSVGIASTKFVAKLASARCKPDGLLVVPVAGVRRFLDPLPVTALWGVGDRTAQSLRRLGLRTVADLAATPPDAVRRAVGGAMGDHLIALARGRDERRIEPHQREKSISAERTYPNDLTDSGEVLRQVLALSGQVGARLRSSGLVARTVGIKIRFADFRTITRVRTLAEGADADAQISRWAAELYRSLDLGRPRIRLVGVRAEQLAPAARAFRQMELDVGAPAPDLPRPASASAGTAAAKASDPALSAALDRARARFGAAIVQPASLTGPVDTSVMSDERRRRA